MIAVVIPVYNGAGTIEKSLNSLIGQTFTAWIAVVVNDGSTDSTLDILEGYKSDPRFVIVNESLNRGRGYARNVALKKAASLNVQYLCMLDADDVYHPEKLALQYAYMQQNTGVTLLSNAIGVVDDFGQLYSVSRPYAVNTLYNYKEILEYRFVPHASSIIRFSDIDVAFDEHMRFSEDQDFMMRLLKNKTYAFDTKLLYYYYRDQSFSVVKYRESLRSEIYSLKKMGVTAFVCYKLKFIGKIKLGIFYALTKFGLQRVYFNRIGVTPTSSEIGEFSKITI